MDFVKSLQEAERLGISRDLFIAAWEREVALIKVKEEAKVLELKKSLASPNQQNDSFILPQIQVMMNQLIVTLQQPFVVLNQELEQIKHNSKEMNVNLIAVSGQVRSLQLNQAQFQETVKNLGKRLTDFDIKISNLSSATVAAHSDNRQIGNINNLPSDYESIGTFQMSNKNISHFSKSFSHGNNVANVLSEFSSFNPEIKSSNSHTFSPEVSERMEQANAFKNAMSFDPWSSNYSNQKSRQNEAFDIGDIDDTNKSSFVNMSLNSSSAHQMSNNSNESPISSPSSPTEVGYHYTLPQALDPMVSDLSLYANKLEASKSPVTETTTQTAQQPSFQNEDSIIKHTQGQTREDESKPKGPISWSSVVKQKPKVVTPVKFQDRVQQSTQQQPTETNHDNFLDVCSEFKIGTSAGPLSQASFSAAIRQGMKGKVASLPKQLSISGSEVIPPGGIDICIRNISKALGAGKVYESNHYYTRGQHCKISLSMWLQKKYLGVAVTVSPGLEDGTHSWPLTLYGTGKIYNFGSRCYTQLWEVEPESCSRVGEGEEWPLRTGIYLCSKREPVEDVTFEDLVKKRYIERNTMYLKWDMEAQQGYGSVEHSEPARNTMVSGSGLKQSTSNFSVDSGRGSFSNNSAGDSCSSSIKSMEPPLGMW